MRRTKLLATTALAALALPPAARADDGLTFALVSNSTDFSSLLPIGDRLYSVSHFEARPGAVYLTELRRDPATGDLGAVDTRPVDFSALGGVWNPCAGSVTPWGTHLGSEEYEPDARSVEAARSLADVDTSYKPMALYAGFDAGAPGATLEGFRRAFDPYRYGWTTEVRVVADGTAEAAKHYAMGRMSHELAYVMPDRKTVYETDDGTNVDLFMFVADEPGRPDSGPL